MFGEERVGEGVEGDVVDLLMAWRRVASSLQPTEQPRSSVDWRARVMFRSWQACSSSGGGGVEWGQRSLVLEVLTG